MHVSVRYANHIREPYEYVDVEFDTIILDDLTIRTVHFNDEQWHKKPEGVYWQWNRPYDVAKYIYETLYADAGGDGMTRDEIMNELEVLTRQVLLLRKNREFDNPGRNV